MLSRLFITSLLLICVSAANAQYADIAGQFRSASTTLNLIALDAKSGVIAAETVVAQGSCSGSVAGVGRVVDDVLTFSPYMKTSKDDKCVSKVEFDTDRKTAKITGNQCIQHSGAACGWEGDRVHRVRKPASNR